MEKNKEFPLLSSTSPDPSKTQKIKGTEEESFLSARSIPETQTSEVYDILPSTGEEAQQKVKPFITLLWPNQLTMFAGVLIGMLLLTGWLLRTHILVLEVLDTVVENDEQSFQQNLMNLKARQEIQKKYQQQQETSRKYLLQTQKNDQEIAGLRQSMALLSSNALAQEKLQKLSAQNEVANTKMEQVAADSKETLIKTRRQMEILEDANQRLQEEVDRLKLMQAETLQKMPPTNTSDRQAFRMNWTDWVDAQDASSFLRESVIKKSRLPLAVEGRLSKSGSMFRFFLIPNLYQIRWQVEWGLTEDALVKKISYLGGKKYYELHRQTFMLNSSAPMHQVVFIHQLDMDEAKRLKSKYFVSDGN